MSTEETFAERGARIKALYATYHPETTTGGELPPERANGKRPSATAVDHEWGPAVPLDSVTTIPAFPLDSLPSLIQGYTASISHATQTPIDLAAMLALAILASVCAGAVDLEVREGWIETLNLYIAIALLSGESKSPVFRAMTAALRVLESEMLKEVQDEIVEARVRKATADGRAEDLTRIAAKTKGDYAERGAAEEEAIRATQEAANLSVPAEPRLFVEDVTAERLVTMLAEQQGRLALLSDEGGAFAAMAGRYEQRSGGPKGGLDVWLKAYDGSSIRVDRVGRSADVVECPTLTMGLTVQPTVLRGLMSEPDLRGRGLLARFCYSLPVSRVGARDSRADPVDPELQGEWDNYIVAIARSLRKEGARLTLTPEAAECLTSFRETIEPRLRVTGDLHSAADWMNKLGGRVARIAALLHLGEYLRSGWQRPISAETMEKAIAIGRYLLSHALVAFDLMGTDENRERTRYVLRLIADHEEEFSEHHFTRRDVMAAGSRAALPTVETTQLALDQLVEFGWIRVAGKTLRHGTAQYELRPALRATVATVTTVTPFRPSTMPSVASVASVVGGEDV